MEFFRYGCRHTLPSRIGIIENGIHTRDGDCICEAGCVAAGKVVEREIVTRNINCTVVDDNIIGSIINPITTGCYFNNRVDFCWDSAV